MKRQFQYGKYLYEYTLKFEARKSLSLTVTPSIELIVKAPHDVDQAKIESFLKRKWIWLETQIQFFNKFRKKLYRREYVSGESVYYLGRQYKLVVQRGSEGNVSLKPGIILLTTKERLRDGLVNKRILEDWYKERAHRVFNERLSEVANRFGLTEPPKIQIKQMSKRWGSFMGKERIILNKKLIHASKDCIDYVIVHELCHFKYKKHSPAFFRHLSNKYPGWEKVKEKLEMRYL